jgi:glycosyltransferase involved in cell wall biosynthesis
MSRKPTLNSVRRPSIDISVIVPVYNTANHVEACIQGLLGQRYSDGACEYILVDNNSTDGSAEIVKRYPAVRLLSQPKQGSYAARNLGLSQARGQIIAFTDSDCVPRSDWLQQIAHTMRNPGVDIVLGRREFQGRSHRMNSLAAYEGHKARYIFSGTNRDVFYGYTNNLAVRRSLMDAMGPFVETGRGSDVIFVRRAVDRFSCQVLRYSPDVVVQHLEITKVWDWYKKMYIYGGSYQNYRTMVVAYPLSNAQRLEVFNRMRLGSNLSWLDSAGLLTVLGGGVIAWELGRLSPRITKRSNRSLTRAPL